MRMHSYAICASIGTVTADSCIFSWTECAFRVFLCVMSANNVEIEVETSKILKALPEDVRETLRAEAVKRRVPLVQLIKEALVAVAAEVRAAA